jgi:hypothetical protein
MNYFAGFRGLAIMRRLEKNPKDFLIRVNWLRRTYVSPKLKNSCNSWIKKFTRFTRLAGLTGLSLSLSLTRGLNPLLSSIMRRFAVETRCATSLHACDGGAAAKNLYRTGAIMETENHSNGARPAKPQEQEKNKFD